VHHPHERRSARASAFRHRVRGHRDRRLERRRLPAREAPRRARLKRTRRTPSYTRPRNDGDEYTLTVVATRGYLSYVKVVAIKELKNRLSAYLRDVKNGEVVLVTDRGKVVAELRQPRTGRLPSALDDALERLHAAGVLTPGLP